MSAHYRLEVDDFYEVLDEWNAHLKSRIFIAACGGTALTLYGHKESTQDVDLLVPDPAHYRLLIKVITELGYTPATGNGFRHPREPWIFDLFRGQTIFQTGLLDPVQESGKHRVIKEYERIVLSCLNPDDLIISKMFRGTLVDVQDSIVMIKAENLDLRKLAERYKETAGYYYSPATCKKNLGYLIKDMEEQQIDATPLREMSEKWTP
ncbi:MAG: hypothetical protein IT342_21290 [Candidatus Melainabacteria bacterium]|nr:hypothetical protein [Candidatus Melainabacteria bacterium]